MITGSPPCVSKYGHWSYLEIIYYPWFSSSIIYREFHVLLFADLQQRQQRPAESRQWQFLVKKTSRAKQGENWKKWKTVEKLLPDNSGFTAIGLGFFPNINCLSTVFTAYIHPTISLLCQVSNGNICKKFQ